MPPVSMTRAEYEKKYGIAPVAPPVSKIDTTPSPIRMSREEYTKTYGVTPEGKKPENNPVQNVLDRKPAFPANEDTSNPLGNIARTFGNIPSSAINLARTMIADPVQNFVEADKALLDIYKQRGPLEGTKDILGGFADTYLKAGEAIYGGVEQAYNALLDNPKDAVEKTSNSLAKIGIEDPLFIPSLLYGGEAVGSKDLISKIASPITRGVDTSLTPIVTKTGKAVEEATADISKGIREKQVADTADEIYAVEQNYSKARKLNQYATDGGAEERARIARSNVLEGSVTTDGVIRTKQPGGAVERYREATIDGYEDVVKKGLEREGSKVNLSEVERALTLEVDRSGLEGADLITAMNGIKKEIAGLARRADESGNVFLSKLQDAKIGTTRNINYQTPPETATYRKAVARAYKNTIENKSSLNVRQVNEELAKYYKDIERLEGLDGLRVKGGKLGKYTAQIAGNVGGGLVGGAIGGVPGAAIGTVVGGEISGALKGRSLSESFGKLKEGEIPKSSILEDAKAQNQLPKVVDLKTPDPIVGVRKDIPKTKEVIEIEAQIKNNVRKQKLAIKAGDFTLVEKLKEIYQALVEKLREVVKVITEKGPPQRGFIRIGGEGKDAPKSRPKSSAKSPSPKSTTEPETFKGYEDLSTKLLEKLKGRTTVSREFIENLTNQPDLKQAERDLIRRVLGEGGDEFIKDNATRYNTNAPQKATGNAFQDTLPSGTRPSSVKEITQRGGNPLFHDTTSQGVLGILKDGEIKPSQAPFSQIAGQGVRVSTTRNFDNYSRYGKAPYRFILDESKTGQKAIPDNREEFESIFRNGLKTDSIESLAIDTTNPSLLSDMRNGKLKEILDLAKSKGIRVELFEGKLLPDEFANKEVQAMTRGELVDFITKYKKSQEISVPDFANKVKSELLPLDTALSERSKNLGGGQPRYENISLPDELRGPVANYEERVYQSPINTSGGSVHFNTQDYPGYFAHTRIEDLPGTGQKGRMIPPRNMSPEGRAAFDKRANELASTGDTRRVIELQSDLFQKGRLEGEVGNKTVPSEADRKALAKLREAGDDAGYKKYYDSLEEKARKELAPLEPYRNTWHERVIREEVKQAAKDGKTKLQFPTGETAMKIEGLGGTDAPTWYLPDSPRFNFPQAVKPENLKVGETVRQGGFQGDQEWIITDVLGDGKFKAMPKEHFDSFAESKGVQNLSGQDLITYAEHHGTPNFWGSKETFDISGKVDTENPIYKFYEKTVQKYLTNKYGGKVITDPQGVKWVEIDIKPEMKGLPIEAFGVAGIGVGAGVADNNK